MKLQKNKHKIGIGILLVILSCIVSLSSPLQSLAKTECADVQTSIISCGNSDNGIWSLLLILVNILSTLILFVAIGGLVYGAVLYSSAADDSSKVAKAKSTISNIVVGIVLFAGMYSFLQYLIPGGVFNRDFNIPIVKNNSDDASGGKSNGGKNKKRAQITATFSFQNLGRKEASATAVFQKIKDGLNDRSNVIYSFVEIDEGDDGEHGVLKRVFGSNGWSGFNQREPILNRLSNDYVHLGSNVIKLHNGISGLSPTRFLVVGRYARADNGQTKLAVINTHFLTHAYNNHTTASARGYWDKSWSILKSEVARLRGNGYDIVVTGDFNRSGTFPGLNGSAKQIVKKSPDFIFAVPSKGRKVSARQTGTIYTPSGESFHQDQWARITFSNTSK